MTDLFNVVLIRKSRLTNIPYWLKEYLSNVGIEIKDRQLVDDAGHGIKRCMDSILLRLAT